MVDRDFEFYNLWHQTLLRSDAFINSILYFEKMHDNIPSYEKIEACEIIHEYFMGIYPFLKFHKVEKSDIWEWFSQKSLKHNTHFDSQKKQWIKIKTPNDMLQFIMKLIEKTYNQLKYDEGDSNFSANKFLEHFWFKLDFLNVISKKPFTASASNAKYYPDEIKRYLGIFDLRSEGFKYKEILSEEFPDIYPFNKYVIERVKLNNDNLIYAKRGA